jgi:hypothetical protein
MPVTVHHEPDEFRFWEAEDCVDCRQPTRYWLTPHVPLCPNCAANRPDFMIQIDERLDEARLRQFASRVDELPPHILHFIHESFLWEEGPEYYHGLASGLAFAYQTCPPCDRQKIMGAALAMISKHIVAKGWW